MAPLVAAQQRPNILLITADDMNWDSVGAYGCPVPGTTPRLDELAAGGMRFERAHVTVAVCAPSRKVLMTGRYPHHTGAHGFGPLHPDVTTLPELLGASGYLCGIIDKVGHLQPVAKFGWDTTVGHVETGNGRNPERFGHHAGAFFRKARDAGKPFFLMANSRDPHRPFAGSRQERQYIDAPRNRDERNWANPEAIAAMAAPSRIFQPGEVVVPGFLPDVPDIREEVAHYYGSVRRCDDAVGAILDALDQAGLRENTLVVFLSDNGMAFPFAKFSCYLHGTRTPLIVRWPGRIAAGAVNRDDLVSGIDLAPMLLDAAGLPAGESMDGRSFLPLLKGEDQREWNRLFTAFYETALGELVPTRAVHERRYGYIFNRWADGATQAQNEFHKGLALQAMIRAARAEPAAAQRVVYFLFRAQEELYDFEQDPDGMQNLATDPSRRAELDRLRTVMLEWMGDTRDPLRGEFEHFLAGNLPPMSGVPDPSQR